jgi:putative drug exporter of the RND superfamily
MPRAREGGVVSRTYGWITALLSPVIVVAWVAAVVAAWMFLPALGGSASAPLGDIVPEDAEALGAQQRAFERFGTTLSSDTLIVQRNPEGLSEQELRAAAKGSLASLRGQMPADLKGVRAAVPLVNAPLPGVKWGEENTTILTYLFLGDDLNLVEREAAADRYTREVLRPSCPPPAPRACSSSGRSTTSCRSSRSRRSW